MPRTSLQAGTAMDHDSYSDSYIAGILNEVKSFAMVGASANTVRPSYFALKYLVAKGYRVFPVNPGLASGEIHGQKVFANLAALEEAVDVIDIFRNSQAALGIVQDALALKDRLRMKVIWMQLGIRNDEAARLAEEAGLKVVMNRCPKIEYGRLSGEIAWAGVNNRMISSQKPLILGKGFQQLAIRKPNP
jgi:predicted CoA-binding protein